MIEATGAQFEYVADEPDEPDEPGSPELSSMSPDNGLGVPDTAFTLHGSHLAGVTRVVMRRTGAEVDLAFTVVSDGEITSVTGTNPPGAGMVIWTSVYSGDEQSNELEGSVGGG